MLYTSAAIEMNWTRVRCCYQATSMRGDARTGGADDVAAGLDAGVGTDVPSPKNERT